MSSINIRLIHLRKCSDFHLFFHRHDVFRQRVANAEAALNLSVSSFIYIFCNIRVKIMPFLGTVLGKTVLKQNIYFDLPYTVCLEHFSI